MGSRSCQKASCPVPSPFAAPSRLAPAATPPADIRSSGAFHSPVKLKKGELPLLPGGETSFLPSTSGVLGLAPPAPPKSSQLAVAVAADPRGSGVSMVTKGLLCFLWLVPAAAVSKKSKKFDSPGCGVTDSLRFTLPLPLTLAPGGAASFLPLPGLLALRLASTSGVEATGRGEVPGPEVLLSSPSAEKSSQLLAAAAASIRTSFLLSMLFTTPRASLDIFRWWISGEWTRDLGNPLSAFASLSNTLISPQSSSKLFLELFLDTEFLPAV
mmetsp:Transcript_1794/g.2962  ORF Transcript_1794/g.2962 Transcript_1794/m.2962 type:complete len:270 (-) Transcript_1794:929-1738(-)